MDAVALRPFYRRKSVLTSPAQEFYQILKQLVRGHQVLAKVRLADLVGADERHLLRKSNFDHIKAKHIDFVICDRALAPIIAIELDDSSHRRPDRIARDRDVDRILEIAALPLVRFPVRPVFNATEIAKQLLAKLNPV
jgi:Protein of unknown function (DUF2726)